MFLATSVIVPLGTGSVATANELSCCNNTQLISFFSKNPQKASFGPWYSPWVLQKDLLHNSSIFASYYYTFAAENEPTTVMLERNTLWKWAIENIFSMFPIRGNFQPFSDPTIPLTSHHQVTRPPTCSWLSHEDIWSWKKSKRPAKWWVKISILAFLISWGIFHHPPSASTAQSRPGSPLLPLPNIEMDKFW